MLENNYCVDLSNATMFLQGSIQAHAVRKLKNDKILYKIWFTPYGIEQKWLPLALCTVKGTKKQIEKFVFYIIKNGLNWATSNLLTKDNFYKEVIS